MEAALSSINHSRTTLSASVRQLSTWLGSCGAQTASTAELKEVRSSAMPQFDPDGH